MGLVGWGSSTQLSLPSLPACTERHNKGILILIFSLSFSRANVSTSFSILQPTSLHIASQVYKHAATKPTHRHTFVFQHKCCIFTPAVEAAIVHCKLDMRRFKDGLRHVATAQITSSRLGQKFATVTIWNNIGNWLNSGNDSIGGKRPN